MKELPIFPLKMYKNIFNKLIASYIKLQIDMHVSKYIYINITKYITLVCCGVTMSKLP